MTPKTPLSSLNSQFQRGRGWGSGDFVEHVLGLPFMEATFAEGSRSGLSVSTKRAEKQGRGSQPPSTYDSSRGKSSMPVTRRGRERCFLLTFGISGGAKRRPLYAIVGHSWHRKIASNAFSPLDVPTWDYGRFSLCTQTNQRERTRHTVRTVPERQAWSREIQVSPKSLPDPPGKR